MWYMHDWSNWWIWFGGIDMFFFWGALIALAIWAIIRFTRRDYPVTHSKPLDIAKERYARGEITKEQFDQIKRDLQ